MRIPGPLVGFVVAALVSLFVPPGVAQESGPLPPWLAPYRDAASRLIGAAYADHAAWQKLAELTDTFGARHSGSPALAAAIQWAADRMRSEGFDEVRLDPVMIPHWVRGRESLTVVKPFPRPLVMLGLGGSVATPPRGIEAEALVVSSYADLEEQGARARGRIVVFNVPYVSYGETVQYRYAAASRAAQLGAVGALVRSVGPVGLRTPHTGALNYGDSVPRIPAASVAAEDAEALGRMQARGERVVLRLEMESHFEPDVESANVIGEVRGIRFPDEIVVVGCHFDSWDVGTGASDDGVGCIVAWEAARLMKVLGLRPHRTVRVVLFANEENGLRGGHSYRDRYRDTLRRHVLLLESDTGVFPPLGVGVSGGTVARDRVRDIVRLLNGIGIDRIDSQGGGADIGPSAQAAGIPSASINGDPQDYFRFHHTQADTIDRIDPEDVSRAVAGMAVIAYLAAEMPERLDETR